MYLSTSSFSSLALFLTVLLRSDFCLSIQIIPPPPSLLENTTKAISPTPLNTSTIQTVTLPSSTTSSQGVKINHERNVTVTTPLPTISTSEVSDMTSNSTYTGGRDVDEVGNKTKHDKPPKEQSKIHSKSTTSLKPSNDSSSTSNPSTTHPTTTTTILPSTTSTVKTSTASVVITSTIPSANMTMGNGTHTEAAAKQSIGNSTTAAGIVAFVCVGIAASAFAALLAWRYVYRKRNGNREILINEEDIDFNDEDLRHFEATSIQLEPEA